MKMNIKRMLVMIIAVITLGTTTSVAKDVYLTIGYGGLGQFGLSQKMDSEDHIDIYVKPYNGYRIVSIKHYDGARNAAKNRDNLLKTVSVNTTGTYHYVDDEPIGDSKTLLIEQEYIGDNKTTGVEEAVVDEAFSAVIVSGKTIVVEGAAENELMTVTALNGTTIYTGFGRSVDVAESGVYVVTVGETSTKVLVK